MDRRSKPIEATEITFSDKSDFEKFTELVKNPAKPSKYVEDVFKAYQQKKRATKYE